jgi:hypothetical protein
MCCDRAFLMYSLSIPFFLFWFLLYFGRDDLGWKWILGLIGIWAACLAGFVHYQASPYLFVTIEALIDVVLVIVLFRDVVIH